MDNQVINFQVSQAKNNKSGNRNKAERLRVTLHDGKIIQERTAVATLIEVLRLAVNTYGAKTVTSLGLRRRGYKGSSCLLLVSHLPEGQSASDYTELDFLPGYLMRKKSETDEKVIQLDDLNKLLNMGMTIAKIK